MYIRGKMLYVGEDGHLLIELKDGDYKNYEWLSRLLRKQKTLCVQFGKYVVISEDFIVLDRSVKFFDYKIVEA